MCGGGCCGCCGEGRQAERVVVGRVTATLTPAGRTTILVLVEVPQQVPATGEQFTAARAGVSASVDVLVLVVGSRVTEHFVTVRTRVQACQVGPTAHLTAAATSAAFGVAASAVGHAQWSSDTTNTTTLSRHRRPRHHQRASCRRTPHVSFGAALSLRRAGSRPAPPQAAPRSKASTAGLHHGLHRA